MNIHLWSPWIVHVLYSQSLSIGRLICAKGWLFPHRVHLWWYTTRRCRPCRLVFFLQMFIIAKLFLSLSANCNLSVFNALWSNISLYFPSICISVQWNGRAGLSQVLGSNPTPSLPEDGRRVVSRTASGIKTSAKSVHTQLRSGGGGRAVATPWREVPKEQHIQYNGPDRWITLQ